MPMKYSLLAACCLSFAITFTPSLHAAEPEDGVTTIMVEGSTLEDFFTAALDYSPRLRIAEERWSINTSRKKAYTGQLLPQINANGSISDNTQEQSARDITNKYRGERYSVQLTQVLFNWSAFARRSKASLLEDQAEAEYYAELAWLLADVADKYFAVLAAEDAVSSIDSEFSAMSNQLAQIQRLYDLQSAQITDLYATQARLASVQAEQLDLISQLALTREQLRALTGVNVGPLFRLDEDITVPPIQDSVNDWLNRARSGNMQIRARQYAVEAAEKGISEQRGSYMPRVTFIAQKQLSDIGYDNTPQVARTDTSYIGLDVSIPIFTGGTNRASVSEAKSQHSIAENELRQVELEIVERTRTAYLQAKSSETRVQAARKVRESTALSYTAMQRGFELGTVNSVDVLNALRDRFRSERDLQSTRYDHIKYSLFLKREAGTLSPDDLLDVGNWLVPPDQ